MSFKEFLGLTSGDRVPDSRTIWLFQENLIQKILITSAEVHDSQPLEELVEEKDKGQEHYADSAYIGEPINGMLNQKGIIPQIIERAFKGKPLTDEQKD